MDFAKQLLPVASAAPPVWDVLLIFFFLVLGFLFGIFLGRARLLAFLLGLYISISIFHSIDVFGEIQLPMEFGFLSKFFPLILFVFITAVVYILLYTSLFRRRHLGDGGWWQILIGSFLATGMVLAEIGHLLPVSLQSKLSWTVHLLLLSDTAYAFWLIVPLVGICVASRRVN